MLKGIRRKYHRARGRMLKGKAYKMLEHAASMRTKGHITGARYRDWEKGFLEGSKRYAAKSRSHYERALQLR